MIVEENSSMPITPKMIETFHRLLAKIIMKHIEEKEVETAMKDAAASQIVKRSLVDYVDD